MKKRYSIIIVLFISMLMFFGISTSSNFKKYNIVNAKPEELYNVFYYAGTEDTVSNIPAHALLSAGTTYTLVSTEPTRVGYKFMGWSLSLGGEKYTSSTIVVNNHVEFYALWQAKSTVKIAVAVQTKTYNGSSQSFEITGENANLGSFNVEYYVSGEWTTIGPINAGSYNVKITREEDSDNCAYSYEISNGLVINAKGINLTWTNTSFTYDGLPHVPTVSSSDIAACDVDKVNITVTGAKIDAGQHLATATAIDSSNYFLIDNFDNVSVGFTISKIDPVYNAPVAITGLKYDGSDQALVSGGSSTVGTLQYCLGYENICGTEWSLSVPTGKLAKTYYVYYKILDETNINGTQPVKISVDIAKISASIKIEDQTYTYGEYLTNDKSKVTPDSLLSTDKLDNIYLFTNNFDVTDNGVIQASNIVIKNSSNQDVTGCYDLTVTNGTLKINKRNITFLLSDNVFETYNGTAHIFTSVSYSSLVGTDTLSYTLNYSDNINAGNCTVSIKEVTFTSGNKDNYNVDTSDTGSMYIAQKTVSFIWGSLSLEYDGTDNQHPTVSIDPSSLVTGDECEIDGSNYYQESFYTYCLTVTSISNSNYAIPVNGHSKGYEVYHTIGEEGEEGYIKFNKKINSSLLSNTLSEGKYYLSSDLTLTSNIVIPSPESVYLDLNGHVLNLNGDNGITVLGSLYIYDSNTNTEHKFNVDENNIASLDDNGSLVIKGGVITGFNSTTRNAIIGYYSSSANNAYSYAYDYGKIVIHNGTFIGNNINTSFNNVNYNEVKFMYNGFVFGRELEIYNTKFIYNHVSRTFSGNTHVTLLGDLIYSNKTFTLNNVEIKNNTFTYDSNSTLEFYGFVSNTYNTMYLKDCSIKDNSVSINRLDNYSITLHGGVICATFLDASNSIISSNKITSTCIDGGLLYLNGNSTLDKVEITDNEITATKGNNIDGGIINYYDTNYQSSDVSLTIKNNSLIKNNTIKVTNSAINGGFIKVNKLLNILNSEISYNTLESIDNIDPNQNALYVKGGLICNTLSSTKLTNVNIFKNNITYKNHPIIYGGLFDCSGGGNIEFFADGVNIYENNINASYSDKAIQFEGGLVKQSSVIKINNTNVYSNQLDIDDVFKFKGGLFYIYDPVYDGYLTNSKFYDNTFDLSSCNDDDLESKIFGLVIYADAVDAYDDLDDVETYTLDKLEIYDNDVTGSIQMIEGLIFLNKASLKDSLIYNNSFTSTSLISDQLNNYGLFNRYFGLNIEGKNIINNNTINNVQTNLVLYSHVSYEFYGTAAISDPSLIDEDSRIGITYLLMDDRTNIIVVENGASLFNKGIFSVDSSRYFLLIDNDDINICGRVIEDPTKDNEYKYLVNDTNYDGNITYQWYRVLESGNSALENNTNIKFDLSKHVIGNYKCIATLSKDGGIEHKIDSKDFILIPEIIDHPTADNQYTFDVNKDRCEENNVEITYEWYKPGENKDQLTYITDQTEGLTNLTKEDVEALNDDCAGYDFSYSYNATLGYWQVAKSHALAISVVLEKNDIIIVSFTKTTSTNDGVSVFVLDSLGNRINSNENVYTGTIPENGTYTFVAAMEFDDPTLYEGEYYGVSIGKVNTYEAIESSRVSIFDEDMADFCQDIGVAPMSYSDNKYYVAGAGIFNIDLEKGETMYAIVQEGYYLYLSYYFGAIESCVSCGIVFNSIAGLTALQTGTYTIMCYCFDSSSEFSTGYFTINRIGGIGYKKVDDQTNKDLRGNAVDTYICRAVYNDGIESYYIQSNEVYFNPFYVSYDTLGANGTITDNTKYKGDSSIVVSSIKDVVKTGYQFGGWTLSSDGSGTVYKANDTITLDNANITLYAIWTQKNVLSIDESAQEYTFNNQSLEFEIKGTNKDLGSFKVEYYVNNSWTTTKPINVSSYNVKITRSEDSNYQAYEKVITNGLTIKKSQATISVDTTQITKTYGETLTLPNATSNFGQVTCNKSLSDLVNAGTHTVTYTVEGTDNYTGDSKSLTVIINKASAVISVDTTQITKTYGESLELPTATSNFGQVTCNKSLSDLVNAGTYTVTYTVEGTDNYTGDSKSLDVVINKKEIVINWCENDFTYNATEQVITASYKDINGNDVSLNVNVDNFVNAGNYVVSVSFKNNETNYKLPSVITKEYEITRKAVAIEKKAVEESKKPEGETKVEIIEGSLDISIKVVVEKLSDSLEKEVINNVKETVSEVSEVVAKFEIYLEDQNGIKVEQIAGNKYKVTLSIPEELQDREGFAIIHIADNGQVTKYDSELVDGKIIFETEHFSTWAIVADELPHSSFGLIILIVFLSILVASIILFVLWKVEYQNAYKKNTLENRVFKFLDAIFLPVNYFIFKQ